MPIISDLCENRYCLKASMTNPARHSRVGGPFIGTRTIRRKRLSAESRESRRDSSETRQSTGWSDGTVSFTLTFDSSPIKGEGIRSVVLYCCCPGHPAPLGLRIRSAVTGRCDASFSPSPLIPLPSRERGIRGVVRVLGVGRRRWFGIAIF